MTRKKRIRVPKQTSRTLQEVIRGTVYARITSKMIPWFVLFAIMTCILISINHYVGKRVSVANKYKLEAEEYKSRNANIQGKLLKLKLESQIGKQVMEDSLLTLENHPVKLIIR